MVVTALRKYSRGCLVVVDEGLRQFGLVALGAGHAHVAGVLDLVEAVDTGFDGQPLQQVHQPARGDGGQLGNGLGGIGQLPCGVIAKGCRERRGDRTWMGSLFLWVETLMKKSR
jgi:hypothetical protein